MPKVVKMRLNESSIQSAIDELKRLELSYKRKLKTVCQRLAEMGATSVSLGYSRSVYNGKKDISVSVEEKSNGYAIVASGESVLFVEFGSGITFKDSVHPQASEFGMGAGTYPSDKGHWDDPNGWWIPKDKGGGHTYGNPPNAVMYNTSKELRDAIASVAREVFASD